MGNHPHRVRIPQPRSEHSAAAASAANHEATAGQGVGGEHDAAANHEATAGQEVGGEHDAVTNHEATAGQGVGGEAVAVLGCYRPHRRILVLWRCLWTLCGAGLGYLLMGGSVHPGLFVLLCGLWAGGLAYLGLLHKAYSLVLYPNMIQLSGGVIFRKVQCFPLAALQGVSCQTDAVLWALGLGRLVLMAAGARFRFSGLTRRDAVELAAALTGLHPEGCQSSAHVGTDKE